MIFRQAAHRARRVANGARQKSFLLSPEVVEKLERLSVVYGSETKAVERLINVAGDALTIALRDFKEGGS